MVQILLKKLNIDFLFCYKMKKMLKRNYFLFLSKKNNKIKFAKVAFFYNRIKSKQECISLAKKMRITFLLFVFYIMVEKPKGEEK